MIPDTLSGDGDPLDVLVIGESVPRGSAIKVKPIGIIRLLNGAEIDDKIAGVFSESILYSINDISELNEKYMGITTIIETWFTNYKGSGKIVTNGWGGKNEAHQIIDKTISSISVE